MAYKVHIVSPAKREIKKLDRPSQIAVVKSSLGLGENPRPDGYVPVQGQKDLYRIHVQDAPKFRIIFSIQDHLRAIIIVTVRLKGKGTYRNIPLQNLSAEIRDLEKELSS